MAEFLAMGGYAQFVWSSFGFWLVCVIFNIVSARRKIRASLEQAAIAAARQRHRRKRNKDRKLKQT
jgi:heme exporter protein D